MEVYNKKVVLITGGTSGIGYQATLRLLNNGHKVIVLCKSESRADYLKNSLENEQISSSKLNELLILPIVDLSDLSSIDYFANNFLSSKLSVDSLICNAGLQYTGSRTIRRSAQNVELTIAVNHLSHHFLLQRLLPKLLESDSPRVVITSSEVHNPESGGGKIGQKANLGQLEGLKKSSDFLMLDGSDNFDSDKAYKDSKLCNILFGRELSLRLVKKNINIPVICWAPGLVIPRNKNGFFRHSRKYNEIGQIVFAFIARDLLRVTESPKNAGQILKNLAISEKYTQENFVFISNKIKSPGKMVLEKGKISDEANDLSKGKKLWDLTNKIIGNYFNYDLF